MLAKFIGRTSMGFVYGKEYNIKSKLKTIWTGGSVFGCMKECICIYDQNSMAWCPYESLESFNNNWIIKQ